jgi:hypothetical protein
LVSFFQVGLGDCINCNPVPRETRGTFEAASKKQLNSAGSGLQLVLEIALSDVSAKVQPHDFFIPVEDALKRRMT